MKIIMGFLIGIFMVSTSFAETIKWNAKEFIEKMHQNDLPAKYASHYKKLESMTPWEKVNFTMEEINDNTVVLHYKGEKLKVETLDDSQIRLNDVLVKVSGKESFEELNKKFTKAINEGQAQSVVFIELIEALLIPQAHAVPPLFVMGTFFLFGSTMALGNSCQRFYQQYRNHTGALSKEQQRECLRDPEYQRWSREAQNRRLERDMRTASDNDRARYQRQIQANERVIQDYNQGYTRCGFLGLRRCAISTAPGSTPARATN